MTATEPKPRGRLRKTPVPTNPDEAVATKGYVKCVARLSGKYAHEHRVTGLDVLTTLESHCVVLFGMSVFGAILFGAIYSVTSNNLVLAIASICTTLVIVSYIINDACYTRIENHTELATIFKKLPPELERWEPPEPKKEC